MQCPYCSYQNPVDAKFCQNCGKPLSLVCPNCGTANEAQARFCRNCGTNLLAGPVQPGEMPANPMQVRLQRYIPKELLAKLAAAPAPGGHTATPAIGGERRVVTILFCDVEGSTALAEGLDPEEWVEIMNNAFAFLITPVYRYEGIVARLMGDAILAFFGAPIAHEDDPERAILAALDILEGARSYGEKLERERGLAFKVRIGINTGLVTVGEVGSDLHVEYTAMGDVVNLAARLQSAAEPMTILVSENTRHLIAPAFEWADQETIQVKGKSAPIHVSQVLGRKAMPGRLRGIEGLESPIVGRDAELDALQRASDALKAGLGRTVVLVGEPGLGKSRLIAEWKANVLGSGTSVEQKPEAQGTHTIRWAEGHCLSYGQDLAYHLLLDGLRSLLGVSSSAGEDEIKAALNGLIADLPDGPSPDAYTYLGHLLSIKLEAVAVEQIQQLEREALRRYYLAALEHLLRGLAARQRLVLVFEDIHWADPASVELIARLLPLALEIPVLFCFATRPDRDAPGWRLVVSARETMGASLTELALSPLSQADSHRLVGNLLESEALPQEVRSLIMEKAEGNPLFVEELIRMLIERKVLFKQGERWEVGHAALGEIPDTLQGLLLARIDRLPEEIRYVLRVASVIGRQFPVGVLEQVLQQEGG